MSLRGLKGWLAEQLAETSWPDTLPATPEIRTQVRTGENVNVPVIWISGGSGEEERTAGAPRYLAPQGGKKELAWTLDLWLLARVDPAHSDPDQFDDLIEAVLERLRDMDHAGSTLDPVTGVTTKIREIGDSVAIEYPPPRKLTETSSILVYSAHIAVQATEWINA